MTVSLFTIHPEQTYTIKEAAFYLGIHRCTIYDYIKMESRPLPFIKETPTSPIRFRGSDLISFKKAGLPKKGRKFKNGHSPYARPY